MIARYGKSYPMDVRMKVLGCTEQTAARTIISELKLPISELQYRSEVAELLDDMLKEAPLMDGMLVLDNSVIYSMMYDI